ncbi:MAG TPA: hypothetical protein VFB06_20125 [Streptosporangiaceae bacterium]|nr:hypothetical protein [Streptosporangiaceae bacterium]
MPKVPRRALKVLSAGLAGAAVLGIATATVPAFAAPAPKPHVALTANQIMKKANADYKAASSFSVYSKLSMQGVTIVSTVQVAPQGCLLTGNGGSGLWAQNLIVGSSEWIRLSNQTWQALGYTGTDLGYVEGKWVTIAAYLQVFGLGNVPIGKPDCHAHQASGLPSAGWALSKKMIKVSGQRAWQLSIKEREFGRVTVAVSDTRTPEYLALTVQGMTEYLSHYNAPVTLAAPPAADVLTSLPPLPPGSIPAADRLVRVDRLVPGLGLMPGFPLEVLK